MNTGKVAFPPVSSSRVGAEDQLPVGDLGADGRRPGPVTGCGGRGAGRGPRPGHRPAGRPARQTGVARPVGRVPHHRRLGRCDLLAVHDGGQPPARALPDLRLAPEVEAQLP